QGGELRSLSPGRPTDVGGVGPASSSIRFNRVQHLPAANGGRRPKKNLAPRPIPRFSLWPDAGIGSETARACRRIGFVMLFSVRLFARARDIVGKDVAMVELPPGATVADLRRRLDSNYPALKSLLEKSALAINNEFADDSLLLPPNSEIALLPPVSGG